MSRQSRQKQSQWHCRLLADQMLQKCCSDDVTQIGTTIMITVLRRQPQLCCYFGLVVC